MEETAPKKILIVEDDTDLRKILAGNLAKRNYIILEAEDGEQALKTIRQDEPNLILLDLLLPKVDGFEVLETVRKSPNQTIARIPVIILSNLWSNKDILRIKALWVEEYYVKANANLDDVYKKTQEVLSRASNKPVHDEVDKS